MTAKQLSEVWKILKEFNFQSPVNLPEVICVSCEKILRNACQVSCECCFCFDCIEEMKVRGLQNCIGTSDDCGKALLSLYMINFKKNRTISQLIMKCPQPKCDKRCPLIEMVDHLKQCPNLGVKCVFHEFGCQQDYIEREEMIQHLTMDQERHSKIILKMFGAMQNEMNEMRNKMTENEREVKLLKEEMKRKDDQIKSMKKEINEKQKWKTESQNEINKMKKEIDSIKKEQKLTNRSEVDPISPKKYVAPFLRTSDSGFGRLCSFKQTLQIKNRKSNNTDDPCGTVTPDEVEQND